jgi:hypothetical protein
VNEQIFAGCAPPQSPQMCRYLHLGKMHEPVLYKAHMSELHDLRHLAPGGPDEGGEANLSKSLLRPGAEGQFTAICSELSQMQQQFTAFARPVKNRVYRSTSSLDHDLLPVAAAATRKCVS